MSATANTLPHSTESSVRSTRLPTFVVTTRWSDCCGRCRQPSCQLRPLKLALLATSTVDHLSEVLRLYLAREGFAAEIFRSEYDTIYQAALDPSSALYEFRPDVIWLFTNYRDIDLRVAPGAGDQAVAAAVDEAINRIKTLWSAIRANCDAHIIQNNADMPLERAFGHFEAQAPWSRTNLLRRFNVALAASHETSLSIFDLEHVAGSPWSP